MKGIYLLLNSSTVLLQSNLRIRKDVCQADLCIPHTGDTVERPLVAFLPSTFFLFFLSSQHRV